MKSPVTLNPSNRFRELCKDINSLTKFLGVDILAPILQFSCRTWTTIFVMVSYLAFTIFSLKNNSSDLVEFLKGSSMLGGLLHGLSKFLTCLLKQKAMRRLTLFSISIYEEYESRGLSYRNTLNTNIDRLLGFIHIVRNGYFITYFIMILLPLVRLIYDGTRITLMQYEIPSLSIEDNFGYSVTYLIQLVFVSDNILVEIYFPLQISLVVQGVGFYAGDMFVFLGLTQILTFADLLQLKVEELNDALEHKAQCRALVPVGAQIEGEKERLHLLLEIIKWHQLFTDYCRTVNGIYHELIATQVLTMALSTMISFIINLNGFDLSLAVYFVISGYSMSIYCILGTKLEFGYDQVYESICNVSWYELSVEQRKLFGLMMREAQHPQTIRILGVIELSVKTALHMVKLIYSASMMVMNRT